MHVTLTPFSDLSHEGPQKYTSDLCVSLSIFHTSRFVLSPCVPFLSHANLLRIVPGLTCHKKHKQDSNTPPQELYGGLDTPNAALASSRAFLPRTLVKASAKISLPDRYFKSMLCSVNWSRRAAARMQKWRFLHVVTVCKMFAMQPVLSDKSSTLKVLLPMRDFIKFKIAIAVTQPKPAAWISASTAL